MIPIFFVIFVACFAGVESKNHSTIMECDLCPESRILDRLDDGLCLCSKILLKNHRNLDQCYRFRKGTYRCPDSSDPHHVNYFDEKTCECKVEIAEPCENFAVPCTPPFSWYENDNRTNCLCTAEFECDECDSVTIVKKLGDGRCICRDLTQVGVD
jgi:hypothetical protein